VIARTNLYRLEAHVDGEEFVRLPFAIRPPAEPSPPGAIRCWPNYPVDRTRMLRGLDWLVARPLDVARLSLGFYDAYDPEEPLQVALDALVAARVPVFVAAGNDGPGDDTQQELARNPRVVSVGAVDADAALLPSSSRGTPGAIGPMFVADGTDYHPQPMESGTSFAAPRVAHVAAFLTRCLMLSRSDLGAARSAAWDESVPSIDLPVVGFADTGYDPAKSLWRPGPIAGSILAQGKTAAWFPRDPREQQWYVRVLQALEETGRSYSLTVDPATVVRAVRASARPVAGAPHEVGYGLVGQEFARELVGDLRPSLWLSVFVPDAVRDLGATRLAALDTELGPLWDEARTALFFDLFFTGIQFAVAKVV
jgi:hypothetical protein